MKLDFQDRDGTRIVTVLEPRIDAAIATQFKEAVRHSALPETSRVLLDMTHVEFLDSSGLGAIVAAMKLLGPSRTLELSALQPNVERVFRLTKMDSVFVLHDSAEDAFAGSARLADAG